MYSIFTKLSCRRTMILITDKPRNILLWWYLIISATFRYVAKGQAPFKLTVVQGRPPAQKIIIKYLFFVFVCWELKKFYTLLLALLNKIIFEKGDRATELKDLLHLIDFNLGFNFIMFCDLFQILKEYNFL